MKRVSRRRTQKSTRPRAPMRSYRLLVTIPILISIAGLFFVFESSSVRSFTEYGESFAYVKRQIIWIILGSGLMVFFSMFPYKRLYQYSVILMTAAIGLLLLVLLPGLGSSAGGAQRWINLGFFRLQPTEFAKIATVIYLSAWFLKPEKKRFVSFIMLLGFLMFLIVLQPDMGTAVIIFLLSVIMYFLAGYELRYLFLMLPAAIGGFWILAKTSPYRLRRILAFFDPELDPLGITYHINQILISLSSGGIFGRGFGASRQKYLFLPEAHTDSIFAIIGEEVGFVGGVLVIAALFVFLHRVYRVAQDAQDRFGKLLASGIFAYFSIQIIVNLAGMVNLMPLTGVPLSFISYGGSHMLTSFIMTGIVINIARNTYTS